MSDLVLGVRHHGPGSARAVVRALTQYRPDVLLVEGPPEADELVGLAADAEMEPPVALLAHVAAEPARAAFWPFAVFSPEWQAIRYALRHGIPVRFCDLPAAYGLAEPEEDDPDTGRYDPLGTLARTAGYDDVERWWEDVVEHRGDSPFDAVAEAMAELRRGEPARGREARREAYMRRVLRRTRREGFERIAVACGAWHVPALRERPPVAEDDRLLRNLPKVKVATTWVPWTHGRLSVRSGYGAGVSSPGWYHHLFTAPDSPAERWLTEAAGVLREEGLQVSSAHVIEAVRLAGTLAALRDRPMPGLGELTEAVRAVLCDGEELPLDLVRRRLVVGERLGRVPASTPMVPLQRDLREELRRLRLRPAATAADLDLDLRKPLDLERSRLLHRLGLIGIGWGTLREAGGKGTFRERWTLLWRPELDVELIEASVLGTTIRGAATGKAAGVAAQPEATLADLTSVAESCLLADVQEALPQVVAAIGARAALDAEVTHLMAALPALARACRYGDVRGTSGEALRTVVDQLVVRICVGLPAAVGGLDDDAARELIRYVDLVHPAVSLLGAGRERWRATLLRVLGRRDLPGLIDGRLTRLLLDEGGMGHEDAGLRMALSVTVHEPARAAAWVEGFLSGGVVLLIHDESLLTLIDTWVAGLTPEAFVEVLPLLRRTFGAFEPTERRALGDRVRGTRAPGPEAEIDPARAAAAVRTVELILGRAHG
ncbi:DUF5682 family protein [Rhizohabitans arisaemae]|uniref:DUF5682 family protein n=1 Tax=Rhizohabitans arisaemae TaxID=2720610 RepID=UPI0024B0F6E7|nr:DUF5682 family protein [Rhizohabitans arisaemae]